MSYDEVVCVRYAWCNYVIYSRNFPSLSFLGKLTLILFCVFRSGFLGGFLGSSPPSFGLKVDSPSLIRGSRLLFPFWHGRLVIVFASLFVRRSVGDFVLNFSFRLLGCNELLGFNSIYMFILYVYCG